MLRDSAGEVLRVSLGPGDVDCRPYYVADRDDWIVKALVASEDGSFWTHCGVRPLSMLRALAQNVFYRRRISGASTITMQAVRLIAPHRKSYGEKWAEAIRALKMERKKDKVWILSQYLNRAPFGSNFIGVEAAARGWFGKGAKELGPSEAAMLAGMVQAPSRFRPDRGYDAAIKRRDYVLGRMVKLGTITEEQRLAAQAVRPVICRSPRPFKSPYFCDWVMRTLGRSRAEQRLGGDYVTSLDADVQAVCDHAVNAAAEGRSASAVVMKVATGEIAALAVSGNYFDGKAGQVNTTISPRPAGSTLKPFLSAIALDRGFVTPEERLKDVPTAFRGYRPANFDGRYRGLVTLRDALVLSLNVPFVRLLDRLGVETFGDALRSLGCAHLGVPDAEAGLGMAIGNVEVSLVELVAAYGALARSGVWKRPVALAGGDSDPGVRVFSPEAAYLVSDMLSGTERSVSAFGHVADAELPCFAWKTGTSSAYRDAWTVLWNPEYVIGVWCGHLQGGFGDQGVVGAQAAAPVAWSIARALYPRNDGPWFVEPAGVVRRKVCAVTGLPANPDCPATEDGRAIKGRSPSLLCERHRHDGLSPAAEEKLTLVAPEDGAEFLLPEGSASARIVAQVGEIAASTKLWWFADGVPVGTTVGRDPIAVELKSGGHVLTCTTAEGEAVSAAVSVSDR